MKLEIKRVEDFKNIVNGVVVPSQCYAYISKTYIGAYLKVWLAVQCHKWLAYGYHPEGKDIRYGIALLSERSFEVKRGNGFYVAVWYGSHYKYYEDNK